MAKGCIVTVVQIHRYKPSVSARSELLPPLQVPQTPRVTYTHKRPQPFHPDQCPEKVIPSVRPLFVFFPHEPPTL